MEANHHHFCMVHGSSGRGVTPKQRKMHDTHTKKHLPRKTLKQGQICGEIPTSFLPCAPNKIKTAPIPGSGTSLSRYFLFSSWYASHKALDMSAQTLIEALRWLSTSLSKHFLVCAACTLIPCRRVLLWNDAYSAHSACPFTCQITGGIRSSPWNYEARKYAPLNCWIRSSIICKYKETKYVR